MRDQMPQKPCREMMLKSKAMPFFIFSITAQFLPAAWKMIIE
jgi:hypothetical protein